jgi:hypothetical protein
MGIGDGYIEKKVKVTFYSTLVPFLFTFEIAQILYTALLGDLFVIFDLILSCNI